MYSDNTDEQDLDLTGDILTLSGDPTATPIDLSVYSDNTTLASTNLTQVVASTNRTYDVNSGTLSFTNGSVGAGTTGAPTSTLQTGGSFSAPIRSENTGTVTVTEDDYTVIVSGAVSDVDIPNPNGIAGRIYIIKSLIGGNIPSSSPYFNEVGGMNNFFPNGITMIQSDGTDWHKINN